jgi:L-malate glycosyltransferase
VMAMHVLVIASWYSTEERPNAGVFFREQAESLLRHGIKVGILACTPLSLQKNIHKLPSIRANYSKKIENNIPVYRLQYWNWLTLCPSLYLNYIESIGMPAFSDYCSQYGIPDVIHAQSALYGGALAIRIKQKVDVPVVIQEHLSKYLTYQIGIHQKRAAKQAMSLANEVYSVSGNLARRIQDDFGIENVKVIGNSVNTDLFAPSLKQKDLFPFVLTSIGSLSSNKGFDILLKAFQFISSDRNVRLQIVGTGSEVSNLQALAQNLGIADKVNFLGFVSRQDICDVIANSHVVVSASYTETFGITLIEAMASGVPVVSTRSGGPESFVIPDTGILCSPGNVDELESAMRSMVENYASYSPQKIRQYCLENFSEKVIASKWINIYAQLVNL